MAFNSEKCVLCTLPLKSNTGKYHCKDKEKKLLEERRLPNPKGNNHFKKRIKIEQ